MKNSLHKTLFATCIAGCAAMAMPVSTMAQNPADPTNLQATIVGTKVDLSWDRAVPGKTILSTGFEDKAFPGEGWEQLVTNATDYKCSWFHYPTDEVKQNLPSWQMLINSGKASAVVMWDSGWHEDESYVQDEWLVTPVVPGAAFLDFYCFINATALLDYGQYEEFPDHYYVKISHDRGENWEVLWDARYDVAPFDAWQQVSIPLGQTGENTVIAFQAIGDQDPANERGMFFTWALDDITVSTSEAASQAARKEMAAKKRSDVSKFMSHREFTPTSNKKASRPAKSAPNKISPYGYYNLYLDNELLAGYLNTTVYTDVTDKTPGEHTYKVTYYDPATETESAGAELKVTIDEMPFNPPTNLKVAWEYDDETDSYTTNISWEAPEGDRVPAYYNVYRDGSQIAYNYTEFEYGQTMMPKGVFVYQVSAHYLYPTGDSEIVSDIIAIDMRYPAMNINATVEGSDVILNWDAPKAEEGFTVSHYELYRGNTCISSTTAETTYKDANVAAGKYEYSVIAVYTNGEKAMKQIAKVDVGTAEPQNLPLAETFDGGMTPDNWSILTEGTRENYLWRFDNFYELPTTGGGFSNEFASINTVKTGFTVVIGQLCTPVFYTKLEENEGLYIEFDIDYFSRGNKAAELKANVNGNWVSVTTLPSYTKDDLAAGETCKPEHVKYELTDYVYGETMSVSWYYMCSYDGYLSIDNVNIYAADKAGVKDAVANKTVKSVNYFDLMGRQVTTPENGIYIKATTYTDGTIENAKVNIK